MNHQSMNKLQLMLVLSSMLLSSCFVDSTSSSSTSSQGVSQNVQSSNGSSSSLSSGQVLSSGQSSSSSSSSSSISVSFGSMTDSRDGQVYQTVKIGTQVWMAQNLNYGTQVLSTSTGGVQQDSNGTQKWCYQDSAANCTKFGGLYQWHEVLNLDPACDTIVCNVLNIQGICPSGYHVPSDSEFVVMINYLSGNTYSSLSGYLPSSVGLALESVSLGGNDSSGFNMLPAGAGGYPFSVNYYPGLWSRSEVPHSSGAAIQSMALGFEKNGVVLSSGADNDVGFSVRCVQNP